MRMESPRLCVVFDEGVKRLWISAPVYAQIDSVRSDALPEGKSPNVSL